MNSTETSSQLPKLIPLGQWRKELGITNPTIWRWRKQGWINAVIINHRPYVTLEEINRFISRAKAGEFSGSGTVPVPATQPVSVRPRPAVARNTIVQETIYRPGVIERL
jgi:hypothetical protein